MTTQAQILANRCNAQKSTGPRTAEGKAAAAKNATKHGLFARQNVVISEDQTQFDALRDEMLAELAPEGVMETILAERIVSLTWRLKRAERMQDEVIDVKIRLEINSSKPLLSKSLITGQPCRMSKNPKRCYDDLALGLITKWDFAEQRVLERLSMYERRFEASLFRTMAELQKLQRIHRSEDNEENSAIPSTPRGRDARDTQGRDALATARETQGRDALATASATEEQRQCAKQSQSVEGEEDLSPFEKKEYALLTTIAPRQNKANDPQWTAGTRGREAENRPRKHAGVCRY